MLYILHIFTHTLTVHEKTISDTPPWVTTSTLTSVGGRGARGLAVCPTTKLDISPSPSPLTPYTDILYMTPGIRPVTSVFVLFSKDSNVNSRSVSSSSTNNTV